MNSDVNMVIREGVMTLVHRACGRDLGSWDVHDLTLEQAGLQVDAAIRLTEHVCPT